MAKNRKLARSLLKVKHSDFLLLIFSKDVTMKFKKTLLAASLAALSLSAFAQTEDASKDPVETGPSTDWAVTANVSLVSEYRFRGIAQTFGQPAIQGGFDIAMPYGFYVGNWNSNVASGAGYPSGNLETDLYGGWKYAFNEDFGLDTGVLFYLYPGSKGSTATGPFMTADGAGYAGPNSGMVNNFEYYIGGNWKTLSLKEFIAFSDYFGQVSPTGGSTSGTSYTDLTGTQDFGFIDPSLSTWGVVGHLGFLAVRNYSAANYVDWKLGITKDLGNGWMASASYIQTNANGNCGSVATSTQPYCLGKTWDSSGQVTGTPRNLGNATGVVQITKTF
jgi:uncharacterized protein (TIGR02001 family)